MGTSKLNEIHQLSYHLFKKKFKQETLYCGAIDICDAYRFLYFLNKIK